MKITRHIFIICALLFLGQHVNGQVIFNSDSIYQARTPLSGRLWGFTFGDYYYKTHSDSLGRGGANQYTGFAKNDNAFAIRRAYLAYDFNISKRFSTHMIFASEDWNQSTKFTPYLKIINIEWHNIWKGTSLIVGQQTTPAFIGYSEKVWGYRSIERTISDIRRTPPIDFGIALKGTFDAAKNYGYHVMVGNGRGAKAENNRFKNVYGNVYALFFDKKFMINLYADYERLDWKPGFHHSQNMVKLLVGYTGKNIAAGVEGFIRHGKNDFTRTTIPKTDTINMNSVGVSLFLRGRIINKLGFFARVDCFQPTLKFDNKSSYTGFSSRYNPNVREQFATIGLDYQPAKGVHFMPNIWTNAYQNRNSNATGKAKFDYDLVYRLTFYFTFGK